ncbi:hypothetical protein [Pigmentiphaga litoralis]|uniref:hypothetical protein n=1 Tax=Pigmentiphaga litoralis TaxID=516702 RepID=UPI00167336B7|nr:hypothetical protein [Pigmentiphaga litoralis]
MMQIRVEPAQLPSAYRAHRTARGLGWFSLALGLAEIIMPRTMARLCGVHVNPSLMRCYGVREVLCGVGLLTSRNARPWLWARLGGDVLDVGTLLTQADAHGAAAGRPQSALLNVATITALDLRTAIDYEPMGKGRTVDYSTRSGFPSDPDSMRGGARGLRGTPMGATGAASAMTEQARPESLKTGNMSTGSMNSGGLGTAGSTTNAGATTPMALAPDIE